MSQSALKAKILLGSLIVLVLVILVLSVAFRGAEARNKAQLRAPSSFDRAEAALHYFNHPSDDVIPLLIELLADPDPRARQMACAALVRAGPSATDALIEAAGHQDTLIRAGAIRAFGDRPPGNFSYHRSLPQADDERIFPVVVRSLRDDDNRVRESACEVIGDVGRGAGKASQALALLVQILNDLRDPVRGNAAHAIGWMAWHTGSVDYTEARQSLGKIVNEDKSDSLRESALWAMGKVAIRDKEALPLLIDWLVHQNEKVRQGAAHDLALLPANNKKDAIPLLMQAFERNKTSERRLEIIGALRRVGHPLPQTSIPFLVAALDDQLPNVQICAAYALSEMGQDAQEGAPALHKQLDVRSGEARLVMARALLEIEGKHSEIVPIAIPALDDADPEVRLVAISILRWGGPLAKEALPKLRTLMQADPDKRVRLDAEYAVRNLEKFR